MPVAHRVKFACLASVVALFCPLLIGQATAGAPEPVGGWREVVLSVSDLPAWTAFWTVENGWELIAQGELDPASYEGFADSPALGGRQALLRNPGSHSGYVRLVEFSGSQGQQIRPNAQTWDTGGWFDFNARVVDLEAKANRLLQRGWQGYSEPVQFAFGRFVVREWLSRGPDGIVLALIQRVEPPLDDWPNLRDVSRVFNATQVVRDIRRSEDFYVNGLGFRTYLHHRGASTAAGENVLGLPQNLAPEVSREVLILHPQGRNEGSIELLQFDGADGRDLSARTDPPNLGILSVRFAVTDAHALHDRYRAAGLGLLTAVRTTNVVPHGALSHFGLRGPNGEWLEFVEFPGDAAERIGGPDD